MSNLVQQNLIAPGVETQAVEFLRSKLSQMDEKSIAVAQGNGTVNFKRVKAGTIMGRIDDPNNRYRPCAGTTITTASNTATSFDVANADTIYPGDPIFVDGVDSTETVESVALLVVTATGAVTWVQDDAFGVGDGSDVAAGLLRTEVNTLTDHQDVNGDPIPADQAGSLVIHARVYESRLTGDTIAKAADLTGIVMD